jgi:hypothetical protein
MPLWRAAGNGHEAVVKLLLEKISSHIGLKEMPTSCDLGFSDDSSTLFSGSAREATTR